MTEAADTGIRPVFDIPVAEIPPQQRIKNYVDSLIASTSDRRRIEATESTLVAPEVLDSGIGLSVNIPAHFTEMNLGRTLGQYLKQEPYSLDPKVKPPFELFVLVNGAPGEDLESSRAYSDAEAFKAKHPDFPLVLGTAHYSPNEARIGTIRRDMAAITLRRALASEHPDIANMILVTNDADLQELPKDYIRSIIDRFKYNPTLAALTGYIDYPEKDLDSEHVFLTVQRFSDVMEVIKRRRDNVFTMRAGNSAFRMIEYVDAGGFKRSMVSETRPLYKKFKQEGTVGYDRRESGMNIVTSARRQLMALDIGMPQADKYVGFGGENDVAAGYRVPEASLQIPDRHLKYTSRQFRGRVQQELGAYYRAQISKDPKGRDKIERQMKLAAVVMGIRISFRKMGSGKVDDTGEGGNSQLLHVLEVNSIDRLKEGISKRTNRF